MKIYIQKKKLYTKKQLSENKHKYENIIVIFRLDRYAYH